MEILGQGLEFLKRKFLQVKPSSSEQDVNPEQRIERIVSSVEEVYRFSGWQERNKGAREGECGIATDLIKRCGKRNGIAIKTFQNQRVHQLFGATNLGSAFRHAFNTAIILDKYFLIDITCCQFFRTSGEIKQDDTDISGAQDEHLIAQQLLERGFIELTDQSLRQYLAATTGSPDKGYLQKATVHLLMSDPSLDLGYDGGQRRIPDLDDLLLKKRKLRS